MREVGKIKWFGGFNPKLHKLIDYGYITRENKPDLYVNKNHLHCKVKALQPETFVTFEIGLNYKNGMEQALKVKLLKNESEEELITLWDKLDNTAKVQSLYRLCSENTNLIIVEKLRETDILIRALLIIAWVKNNQDKKKAAYVKIYELFLKYKEKINNKEQEKEILNYIVPKEENYKIDMTKPWCQWSILEYLQCCNENSIYDENEDNKEVAKLVALIKKIN